jgi:hypothetical protein
MSGYFNSAADMSDEDIQNMTDLYSRTMYKAGGQTSYFIKNVKREAKEHTITFTLEDNKTKKAKVFTVHDDNISVNYMGEWVGPGIEDTMEIWSFVVDEANSEVYYITRPEW